MTPQELIDRLPMVPFEEHGNDLNGMDCFGLVEFWHKHIFGIAINNRTDQPSEPEGFLQGYEAQNDWNALERPESGAVAVMRAYWNGSLIDYGHCGMIWGGRVYHFKPETGFVHHSIDDRQLRITAIMKHKLCSKS